ncbi:hypothetical protein B0J18DRAFT_19012 [Chaetomium sp. MPI-SDFR-AT-0129]|nr:hypothetical protein B0J18DRAFT_19012 [Chaetomium sp. MPI-SDFR-AT-0129]
MTQLLGSIFEELGLTQYLDAFIDQGFDTWETILDVTESDLDALGVKLGHRRKLQRRIANSRGVAPDVSLLSPTQAAIEELKLQDVVKTEVPPVDGREAVGPVTTKRKYRRHPKPDENAPERPPSAYVLFSNKMREELKGRNLSFTEIAKLVGENWQNLGVVEKEPFESQAQAMKDKYLSDLAEYKKTPDYRKYNAYLLEFKAKHASPSQDKDASKRPRLSELSGGQQPRASPSSGTTRTSRSGSGADSRRGSEPPSSRHRVPSAISSDSQSSSSLAPSTAITSPEDSVLSPSDSNSDSRSSDPSPSLRSDGNKPPSFSSARHSSQGDGQIFREQPSMHRHLPSLSNILDGSGLPSEIRPPSDPPGYHYTPNHPAGSPGPHSLAHSNGDTRPLTNGNLSLYNSAHPPSQSSYSQARQPVDGSLPIHALLSSKPEPPAFAHHQPPTQLPPSPYAVDPNARPMPQSPIGATNASATNGYHQHSQPLPHHHPPMNGGSQFTSQGFSPQQQPPQQPAKPASHFDGMNALLKAGEIVDRRAE